MKRPSGLGSPVSPSVNVGGRRGTQGTTPQDCCEDSVRTREALRAVPSKQGAPSHSWGALLGLRCVSPEPSPRGEDQPASGHAVTRTAR